MEEPHCHFLRVVEGEVVAATAAGGSNGLVGGASTGSGGGEGPFFACGFRDVMVGGGMHFGGGVIGGLMVLGSFGDEGVDREGPGWGVGFHWRSSRFLNSRCCSNFSQPGLNDLTLWGVGCLGGVLGGYF